MNNIEAWKESMRRALASFEAASPRIVGYQVDPGTNVVADPADPPHELNVRSNALRDFYAVVGEVSLPDVHVGYFIHPVGRLAVAPDWGLPRKLHTADIEANVETFGSDGGGGLFAVTPDSGVIYYLPTGKIDNDTYYGGMGEPRILARGFDGFLSKLLQVVEEFAEKGRTLGV